MAVDVRHVTLVFVLVFLVAQLRAQDLKLNPPCVCVYVYLCLEGTVNQDGTGIIVPRSPFNELCAKDGQVCCPFEQMKNDTDLTASPILESSTPPIEENETVPGETSVKPDLAGINRTILTLPSSDKPKESSAEPNIVMEDPSKPVAHPVFAPKPGCGVKRVQIQQRISFSSIDESIARYAEFPWMLAILNDTNSKAYKFQCGASLIHEQVALTAAHCVNSFSVSSLVIRAGEWDVKSTKEPQPHQDRRVSRVELHPFYNRDILSHDIALIFLESPFNITDNVDTICLPDQNSLYHDLNCTVTGWGKDPKSIHGTYNNILHKVEVPVVPCAECENRLRKTKLGPFFKLHHSALCAGGEPDKDSCKGDGGGPLICPTNEENRWVQAGIVSWGIGCGTTTPGVYTDVSVHSGWIHRNLKNIDHVPTHPHHLPSYPYPSNPPNHYPSIPPNHYPSIPPNQYPSIPPNHYPSIPPNHYPSIPPNQYPSIPPNQHPSIPHNQHPSTPHNQYPSVPVPHNHHYSSNPNYHVPNFPRNHYPNYHNLPGFEPY